MRVDEDANRVRAWLVDVDAELGQIIEAKF